MNNSLFKADQNYELMTGNYNISDGIKALIMYASFMGLAFLHGFIYMSDMGAAFLDSTQILIPLISLVICWVLIKTSKDKWSSVGITKVNLIKSVSLGIFIGALLMASVVLFEIITGNFRGISLGVIFDFYIVFLFIIAAALEEVVFRGYIQTRLTGLISNPIISSLVTGILFLSIHYPVKWVISGEFSFTVLSYNHLIFLLLLHFTCDFVYRKTNNLYGSMALHIIYNVFTAALIIG